MKIEDLKVGSFIDLGVADVESDKYGPLLIKSVELQSTEFNTTPGDMWRIQKPHYVRRDTINAVLVNYGGKEITMKWWADEFKDFKKYVLLKATDKEDAFEEFRILRAEKDVNEVSKYIVGVVYDEKMGQRYSMSTKNAMDRLAEDYEITANEKVKELYDALEKVVKLAKNI